MRIFYSDIFVLPLPAGHRFPMAKYGLLQERVAAAALVPPQDLRVPPPASDEQILRAHDRQYLRRVATGALSEQEIRRIGFPWSPTLVQRARQSSGATVAACRSALQDGIAVNLAGGTHHASSAAGQGFCVFNDSVIAARAVQAEGLASQVLIIDCDVHQGNGTAALSAGDPSIFTFSIHGAKNFPFRKEPSDLDIALEDGTGDEAYLSALKGGLRQLPWLDSDLAIYLAGADPYVGDKLGRLALSKEGLARRDQLVFDYCAAADLPVAVVMGGGYAPRVEDIVDIHFETVRLAFALSHRPARAQ
jgi:acetoin utilization deacetylase AcuC-like enzyme